MLKTILTYVAMSGFAIMGLVATFIDEPTVAWLSYLMTVLTPFIVEGEEDGN